MRAESREKDFLGDVLGVAPIAQQVDCETDDGAMVRFVECFECDKALLARSHGHAQDLQAGRPDATDMRPHTGALTKPTH